MEYKVIVDLKYMNRELALKAVRELKDVWGFKIHTLVLDYGLEIVTTLKILTGKKIFLDLKFFDIPSVVEEYARKSADAGADLITIQASVGEKAIDKARNAIEKMESDTKILAVANLTSDTNSQTAKYLKKKLIKAIDSGADGIVCSAKELRTINNNTRILQSLKVVTGIRPSRYAIKSDDQKKTATPKEALCAGADLIVVGRPITLDIFPQSALRKINEEIS